MIIRVAVNTHIIYFIRRDTSFMSPSTTTCTLHPNITTSAFAVKFIAY